MFLLYYIKQGLIDVPHVVEGCLARMLCNEEGVSTGTWQAVTWGGGGSQNGNFFRYVLFEWSLTLTLFLTVTLAFPGTPFSHISQVNAQRRPVCHKEWWWLWKMIRFCGLTSWQLELWGSDRYHFNPLIGIGRLFLGEVHHFNSGILRSVYPILSLIRRSAPKPPINKVPFNFRASYSIQSFLKLAVEFELLRNRIELNFKHINNTKWR